MIMASLCSFFLPHVWLSTCRTDRRPESWLRSRQPMKRLEANIFLGGTCLSFFSCCLLTKAMFYSGSWIKVTASHGCDVKAVGAGSSWSHLVHGQEAETSDCSIHTLQGLQPRETAPSRVGGTSTSIKIMRTSPTAKSRHLCHSTAH